MTVNVSVTDSDPAVIVTVWLPGVAVAGTETENAISVVPFTTTFGAVTPPEIATCVEPGAKCVPVP